MSKNKAESDAANYVGRGGLKLRHAIDSFSFDPRGKTCADFGCNIGGFTDCLLQAGAEHVYCVDTGYGTLAWKLRQDARITVMERTNAMHAQPPDDGVDLVVIDMGWTPQRHAIPAALRWLRPDGCIISLIKPHYELPKNLAKSLLVNGVLPEDQAQIVADRTLENMAELGAQVLASTRSPIRGGASKGKRGNIEYLAFLRAAPPPPPSPPSPTPDAN